MSFYPGKTPILKKDPTEKLSNINVLVLDGGAKAATLIQSIFSALGLKNIFIANDGFQGVQIMKEIRIHMVFTDWELKMNKTNSQKSNDSNAIKSSDIEPVSGLKLVERLRKSPMSPNPYIPIIMMMDFASGKEVMMARDVGVNEILLRPVNAEDFCERLISIIDHPKPFITAKTYKGPCRRRKKGLPPRGEQERRTREVKIIKSITR